MHRADQSIADLHVAQQLLIEVRLLFERAIRTLALACAVDGRLDARLLDEHQFESYELALSSADLLAAETAVEDAIGSTKIAGDHSLHSLDQTLSLIFCVVALRGVFERLDRLFLAFDIDRHPLEALIAGSQWMQLRRRWSSGIELAAAGRAFAEAGDAGNVTLPESLVVARDAFRRFAADVVAPQAYEIHRHDLTVSDELLESMREMGVFGIGIPEKFGGSAPDELDDALMMVVVTEALSEASLAAAGSLITRPEILGRALLAGGTERQKNEWLPRIASGNPLCAIAITEPDYGSDVASLSLKATPTDGGWLLNGAKTWCTFAGKAGVVMVVARTSADRSLGHRGLSVMLVEKPSFDGHDFDYVQNDARPDGARGDGRPTGRLTGRAIRTIGYRGMHSFDLAFDNFFVPDDRVIGESSGVGKGFYYTMAGMVGGRMQTAARALGVMRAALVAALRHGADRSVFGAPLASFQLTQVKLGEMASRFAACRKLTYSVARMLGSAGGGDGRVEASIAKLLACRSAEMITREAQQIHGGMGYAEETAVSRYFVDARVLSIFEGAEETLALKVIARGLLERALEGMATTAVQR